MMNTAVKCPVVSGHFKCPVVSGHFIITAFVIFDVSTPPRSNCTVKLYKNVHIDSFQKDMKKIKHKLSR